MPVQCIIESLFFVRERRKIKVRLAKPDDKKHIVIIKQAYRDSKEKDKDGKPNPSFGKMVYETVDSIDVFESNDAEVKEAVLRGLAAAAKK
jgi:hypothetical protein